MCCHINTSTTVCPDPDPDKWLCPGTTFITSGGASGWGGGISGSWPSLSSYPMVGPNYARQDIDSLPIHIPSSKMIGLAFFYAGFSSPEGNGNKCTISPCANGEGPAVYEGLGGPGVLAFKSSRPISCGVTDPDTGVETAPNIPANNAIYYHNPITLRYDKPSTMLYGVKNEINPNIPPSEDPNYVQKGFKQVLLDPSLS